MAAQAEHQKTSPDSKARLRLWLRLLGACNTIEAELRNKFRTEFESTLPRFDVMAALDRQPEGLKMSQLSQELRVSNGNVTGLIDRLVDDGIASRSPVPGDRRAHLVRLTQQGREQFSVMAKAHEGWIDEYFQNFTDLEAGELTEHLLQLQNRLSESKQEI